MNWRFQTLIVIFELRHSVLSPVVMTTKIYAKNSLLDKKGSKTD